MSHKMVDKIPQGWKKNRLADLCIKIKSGGTPLVSKAEYYGGDIPFVKIEDMTTNGKYLQTTKTTITQEGMNNSSAWLIPKNNILFSIYASVGEVAINRVELTTNQAIMGVIPDTTKIRLMYLYAYLKQIKSSLSKFFKETTQKNLTAEIVKNLEILYPESLKEQDKLAEILTTVDENIKETDKIIEKCERIKKRLMQTLLTKGIPGRHKKFKKIKILSENYEIPDAWNTIELGKVADVIDPHPSHRAPRIVPDGFPFVGIGDIMPDGTINANSARKVSEEAVLEQEATVNIQEGDIAFARVASIGKVAYLTKQNFRYALSPTLSVIRPMKVEREYLYYILSSDFIKEQIHFLSSGGTRMALGIQNLRKLLLLLPEKDERQQITDRIKAVDYRINLEIEKKLKLSFTEKSLMQNLLSGEMRVKV